MVARFAPLDTAVDADPSAELPWLAIAYVSGPSLRQAVGDHGPLPPLTVRLLGGVAEGLAAVHASGIIHRGVLAIVGLCLVPAAMLGLEIAASSAPEYSIVRPLAYFITSSPC